jgi:sortase A
LFARIAIREFDRSQTAIAGGNATPDGDRDSLDFTLWENKRVQAYRASLGLKFHPPLAVLDIPRLRLRAPVFKGTDDLTLNRGLGWVIGTGAPGGDGNVAIAGHRDGFFRVLKDIVPGDLITLELPGEQKQYVVDDIQIVYPNNVDVLAPHPVATITLITCYPFYFIGDAPRRYIVVASLRHS